MPVKRIDVTTPPGHLVQACACCDEERTIRLDRGAAETGHEPYHLAANSDLGVRVDEAPPVNVLFEAEDFQDLNAATAAELAAKLSAVIPGVVVSAVASAVGRGDRVLIESESVGPASRVEIVTGSARTALGFPTLGETGVGATRPVLGAVLGSAMKNKDSIALRRCCCGTSEALRRTWDVVPPSFAGTGLAEQRRAINALAQHLKAQGWVHPDWYAEINAESFSPIDLALGLPGTALEPAMPAATEDLAREAPWGGVP